MALKIGITGGIGSGKSVVTRLFAVLGLPTYDADQVAKSIMVEDADLRKGLIDTFGQQVYFADGSLNRAWLSNRVFNNQAELEKLNALVHPAVILHGQRWAEAQRAPYSVKEAALLFESGSYKQLDFTLMVSSPLDLRIERVMRRDSVAKEQVLARIAKQMPEEEKLKMADGIIYNDDDHSLIQQVYHFHQLFLKGELKR